MGGSGVHRRCGIYLLAVAIVFSLLCQAGLICPRANAATAARIAVINMPGDNLGAFELAEKLRDQISARLGIKKHLLVPQDEISKYLAGKGLFGSLSDEALLSMGKDIGAPLMYTCEVTSYEADAQTGVVKAVIQQKIVKVKAGKVEFLKVASIETSLPELGSAIENTASNAASVIAAEAASSAAVATAVGAAGAAGAALAAGTGTTVAAAGGSTLLLAGAVAAGAGLALAGGNKAGSSSPPENRKIIPAVIDYINPEHGPATISSAVTIAGNNFDPAVTVKFGASEAASYTSRTSAQIVCKTPIHAPGDVVVTVINPDETPVEAPNVYRFDPAPVVSSLSPSTSFPAGGGTVTITGANFIDSVIVIPPKHPTVSFGGTLASDINVMDTQHIACTVPAHEAGLVSILVTNPDEQKSETLANAFEYVKPVINPPLNPTHGPVTIATTVTITGNDFPTSGTLPIIRFGNFEATDVTLDTKTQLTCKTLVLDGAFIGGSVDVSISVGGASFVARNAYTFDPAPAITRVEPTTSLTTGGVLVTIHGARFATGASVKFGETDATNVVNSSSTLITCTAPAHAAGVVSVIVTNPDQQKDTLPDIFTYQVDDTKPTITSVSPQSGPTAGGTTITIVGANFVQGVTVLVGDNAATNVLLPTADGTQITCVTPPGAADTFDVVVTNLNGQSATKSGAFTYVPPANPGTQKPIVSLPLVPATGGVGGGTLVTMTGFYLNKVNSVKFGGVVATIPTPPTANQLTCVTPAHALGKVPVRLDTSEYNTTVLDDAFEYVSAPTITPPLNPANGSYSGGTSVTITGTNFVSGATVTFGTASPVPGTVNPAGTQITCTTPAHASGTVDVTVTNPDTSAVTATAAFTYGGAPSIIPPVSPTKGRAQGGTIVTITGTGFVNGEDLSVSFGGTASPSVTFVSSTQLTCRTPAHAVGTHSITVTNPDGQQGFASGAYTFTPTVSIASISPAFGPASGGTRVSLRGGGFLSGGGYPGPTVTFGGLSATSVTCNTQGDLITCETPDHAAGPVDVVVTNTTDPDDKVTLPQGFTYYSGDVSITEVTRSAGPGPGPIGGNDPVTITGTNFSTTGTVSVSFGDLPATNIAVVGSATITCRTPAHDPGAVDVTVTNPDGNSGTKASAYIYGGPTITPPLNPQTGPTAGGTLVTITGQNFLSGLSVYFGTVNPENLGTNVQVSPAGTLTQQITCYTPRHAAGLVSVTVTNPRGDTVTQEGLFTFASPSIVSLSPSSGAIGGGTPVTITGNNFVSGAGFGVTFGGLPATNIQVPTPTTITCVSPAHDLGAAEVIVTNPGGDTSGTSQFNYTTPTINSVTPTSGSIAGGTSVTILGANFSIQLTAANVTFGGDGYPISNIQVSSDGTRITGTTPAHSSGAVEVKVTNPAGGGSFARPAAYNYVKPTIGSLSPAEGTTHGGTAVTIFGTNFGVNGPSPTVTFTGADSTVSGTVVNENTITCQTPSYSRTDTYSASVTVTYGTEASNTSSFTYHAPEVVSCSPADGSSFGGYTITITGRYFVSGSTVRVNDVTASSAVQSENQITCTVPRYLGVAIPPQAVNVQVTNPSPDSQASSGTIKPFTYRSPRVDSVVHSILGTPDGSTVGNYQVVITGAYFAQGSTVTFDGAPSSDVPQVNSSGSQITCTAPPYTGATVPVLGGTHTSVVIVLGPDGKSGASTFTYHCPTLTSIFPSFGLISGGEQVTLQGNYFVSGATVEFDGTSSPDTPQVNTSGTQITCQTPPHAAGAINVQVINSDNKKSKTDKTFTYSAMTITDCLPAAGITLGGTAVTIRGSGFSTLSTPTVTFNSVQTTVPVQVNGTGTQISCTTPAYSGADPPQGTGTTVFVAVAYGDYSVLKAAFTYHGPEPASFSPTTGTSSGGTDVTILGNYFSESPTVYFGDPAVFTNQATNVRRISETSLTCSAPKKAKGSSVNITVKNSDTHSGITAGTFTYMGPETTSVTPNMGSTDGGTQVVIKGNYFAPNAIVKFDGIPAPAASIQVNDPTTITCVTRAHPATATPIAVQVFNPDDGQYSDLPAAYTYLDRPSVSGVVPNTGILAGGEPVLINGSSFYTGSPTPTVTFGGVQATVTSVSAGSISCTTPSNRSGQGGLVDVAVINPDGQTGTLNNAFTYSSPPQVTSIAPYFGAATDTVTLTGSNFDSFARIYFNTAPNGSGGSAVPTNWLSSSQLSCQAPIGPVGGGTVNVSVWEPPYQTTGFYSTLMNAFTYTGPISIAQVTPSSGPLTGGTSIAITGANFVQTGTGVTTAVTIGGRPANVAIAVSTSRITCTVPAGLAVGSYDIVVQQTDPITSVTNTATLVNGFTYTYEGPSISSIVPSSGYMKAQNLQPNVTIFGANFDAGATVKFGDTLAGIDPPSVTRIVCKTLNALPVSAGPVNVTVTNSDGRLASLPGGFTFTPMTLTAVSPPSGSSGGYDRVIIYGTNFELNNATVTFDGVPALAYDSRAENQIICTTPPHAAGSVDVIVTNPGYGNDKVTMINGFTYGNPTVNSVSPSQGGAPGGTDVIISGTNFVGAAAGVTTVDFGGTAATNVVVSPPTRITCTTQAHVAGAVLVVVTNPNGGGSATSNFTYLPPTISSLNPSSGTTVGETTVNIIGSYFANGATVSFGGLPGGNVTFISASQLTCTNPPHAQGDIPVTVTNPSGSGGDTSSPVQFSYRAPAIYSISPMNGPIGIETPVIITGANFAQNSIVTFGTAQATAPVVNTAGTQITCPTPANPAGPVNVIVSSPDGQSATLYGGFTYNSTPTLTQVSPDNGPTTGGSTVLLYGTNFSAGAQVTFAGTPAIGVPVWADSNRIQCVTPVHVTAEPVTVIVTNPDGQSATLPVGSPGGYTYTAPLACTSVSPAAGTTLGGTSVTLTGTSFVNGATVTFDALAAGSVIYLGSTQLTCSTPAHNGVVGPVEVQVRNPNGQTATSLVNFTYSAPVVSGLSTSFGPKAGGTPLTITGNYFAPGVRVTFGGTQAVNVVYISPTQISCTTPSHDVAEQVDVVVTNADELSATSPQKFEYY